MQTPCFLADVNELRPGPGHQEVLARGLSAIAAMMEPVNAHVRRKLPLHRARQRIPSREDPLDPSARRLSGPDQTSLHEEILGRPIPGGRVVDSLDRRAAVRFLAGSFSQGRYESQGFLQQF